jgi:putative transposase
MIRTYTYKLKPNKSAERKFYQWLGTCRFVYNCSKDLSEQCYRKGVSLSAFDISNQLVPTKKEFPWIAEVHSQTLQAIIERYSNSMKKFFKGAGYPRWATKRNWKSIPFKSIKTTHNAFKLPSFGVIKVFKFKLPKGDLKTATLIKEADGIYLKVVVNEKDIDKVNSENQAICAIDMGITYFLTTSDSEFVNNPKHLFKKLEELRIENRSLARKKKRGKNFYKQVDKLQLLHQKIERVRKDFLHKESRNLANKYETIVREDLNIKGMSKNTKLSKHILDCSWGKFFELLEYKTNVIKVNSKYTSQQCSKCGHTCKENRKTQSLFQCVECGYFENADLQATYNILQRGQSLLEAKVAC